MVKLMHWVAFGVTVALVGCADPNRVVFVTTTKIGIDADITTRSAMIGYDRYEGVVGPAYENGALPPVFGHIETNLAVFQPKIKQTYATGDAALIVTGFKDQADEEKLIGKRRAMFFGTGTNIGLKIVFAADAPESINFGYKRKEYSVIPVGKETSAEPNGDTRPPATTERPSEEQVPDEYGSVLARLDMDLSAPRLGGTQLDLLQFFATGNAADALAQKDEVKRLFRKEVIEHQ